MLEEKMYFIFYSFMENEIEYINVIYRESGFEKEVVNFLKYNVNRVLENLGFEKLYIVDVINLIVLNGFSIEIKIYDFFLIKGNGY